MKKQLMQKFCIGGLALLSSVGAFGQETTVTENFNNNIVPSSFRAGQGYFLSAANGALKVKAGKQQWEEFSYDLPMNLSAAPRVSFKVRGSYYFQMVVALLDSDGNSNRFPDILATFYPSKDFTDVSFDMTSLLKTGDNNPVTPAKVTSIRFMINPGCEAALSLEIDDFKVGNSAQVFPRMIVPARQNVFLSSGQQKVLLRGMLAGSATTATTDNPTLISNLSVGSVNANGTAELLYTPVAGQKGNAKITVSAAQSGKSNLVTSFDVVVSANLAPTVNPIGAQTIGSSQSITIPLSGITDGNTEKEQKITFSATSSDQTVIKNSNIVVNYANPLTNGSLKFTTESLASGSKDVVITLTAKDDGGTASGGVDIKTIAIPVKLYSIYYKSPTIIPIVNNPFAFVGTEYSVQLSGITDGNGGNKVASITATSSNANAVSTPVVVYNPGSNTATLKYTLKNKETSLINVIVTNSGAPANSNGNTSTTVSFEVKGISQPITGTIEDFTTYGVDGKPVSPNVFGADYYSSGTGGNDREFWMRNSESSDQKWFVEGQGRENVVTIDPANKKMTWVVDKPATVPNTFAGVWYSPRKLFDLRNAKYLSLTVSASANTKISFDIFDVNGNRYGLLPEQKVTTTPTTITFVFDGAPSNKNFDFGKVGAILINSLIFQAYKGTITISNLRIGDKAENAPPAKSAEILMQPQGNRTIFAGSNGLDVLLSDVAVMKDGINQNGAISLNVTSSNTSLIPSPPVPVMIGDKAIIKMKPVSGQTGTATISITASALGVANKIFTFNVNVINRNASSAGTVTINTSQTFQTIQGIGSVPDNSYANNMEEMITDQGVSMLRFDLGAEYAGLSETDSNDNSDPFVLDMSKFKFNDRYDFKKSKALGCDRVIGCVWTPPIWMKGQYAFRPQTQFGTLNSLLPDMYDEFAEYIVGACIGFKDQFGYEMYSVSLQNEAEFYASDNLTATCGYTKEQAAEVVRRTYPRLKAAGLSTRIHGFGQLPIQNQVLNWFEYFNNTDTKDMFDAFAIHAYGANAIDPANLDSDNLQKYYAECQRVNPKKELWMTETSGGPTGEAGGVEEFSSQFSAFANNLSAWVPLGNGNKGDDIMRYYSFKNFSKFIRPGAVRVGTVNTNGASGIAFKHDVNKTYTIVLVNSSTTPQQVKLSGSGLPSKMYAYLTANNIHCQLMDSVTSADNYLVYMPAKSVMTLSSKYEDLTENEESIASNLEMVVYPNPSKGELNILLPSNDYKEVSVLDITGRVVLTQAIKANGTGTEYLNLSGLQKGMYIITAKGETTLRKKVVIE